MALDAKDIGSFFSQALGGGAAGKLQTVSAFSEAYSSTVDTINEKLSSVGSVLGTLGLGAALQGAAGKAQVASNAQEVSLVKKLTGGQLTNYLIPAAILAVLAFFYFRKK